MRAAFSLLAVAMCATAHASPITLLCQGESASFPNGFGATSITSKSSRIFTLDVTAFTVRADTTFGTKTAPLATWTNDRTFAFEIPLGVNHGGRLVVSEWGTINRFTGEIRTHYKVEPTETGTLGYSSFTGQCQKAEPKF